MRMGIVNDSAGVTELAVFTEKQILFVDDSLFESSRRQYRLERGTRFETVRHRTIAPLLRGGDRIIVWIECGIIGQCQNFTGAWLDRNRNAGLCPVLVNGSFQFFFCQMLNGGVEG